MRKHWETTIILLVLATTNIVGATTLPSLDDYDSTSKYDRLHTEAYDIDDDEQSTDYNDLAAVNDSNHDWDILIFTQSWPITACFEWVEEDKAHKCVLQKNEYWEIHGIWPTRIGHLGPNFCNKTADFNVTQLDQISEQLELYWGSVHKENNASWLWKHEWLKHGTCASKLESLDNELKYFQQGLFWRDAYLVSELLEQSSIYPDSNNTIVAIQEAIIKILGKNPSIHCIYDEKNDVSYLSEIRLCFDKNLEIMDCDGVVPGDPIVARYPGGVINTNCQISKLVHYPTNVPPTERKPHTWKFPVVNVYKLLKFIMWFTL